ncbi:ethanolamine ammonia-lyase subunit EutB [Methylomonas albis]|uniref:Ethanolamine ammonia-lyase subunit EutB n=1 Tax=Methylomonas albis TaxID=1854563 RepID=A0ABR9CZI0_9GAMM|nr:ethanolamine ammonia-lyase subunit EutB [Methylomonas albis]MBD9356285.1 ethanolamine ammonia-lyase subunit EutB [Methylomonas albis]
MNYSATARGKRSHFRDLPILWAKAMPRRAADELAGLAADSEVECAVAQQVLAEVPYGDLSKNH